VSAQLVLALPKGRILKESVALLGQAGLEVVLSDDDRALTHESESVRVLVTRNADVATYVELGVADAGIVGKDVLLESAKNVYEPVDLNFQTCRMSLIRAKGASGPIARVASKFPYVTQQYLLKANDLEEIETLFYSSARFIVNRAALKLKAAQLKPLISELRIISKT